MNDKTAYRKNGDKDIRSCVKIKGAKNTNLPCSIIAEEKTVSHRIHRGAYEWPRHEEGHDKLRESVLNKLWDSLPPETQMLHDSDDEDSDSTESGLEEGEFVDEENVNESSMIISPENRMLPIFRHEQMQDKLETNSCTTLNSPNKLCSQKNEDPEILWDINLNFIQSIIWLKSTIAKLQRVPADEFFKAFKNQWELSPTIKSTKKSVDRSLAFPLSSSSSSMKTRQIDKIDLIRNRLANLDNFGKNQSDIVIPETDESEAPSLQSSQCLIDRPAAINITASESMGNSTTDSGFFSEKPESTEIVNSSLCIIENDNKRRKLESTELTNVRLKEQLGSFNPITGLKDRTKSRKNRFAEIPRQIKIGERIMKRKHDVIFGAASKTTTTSKRPKLSISSATLNYVLRSSECNQVLVNSVRVILRVLENENNGYYSPGNDWHDSVQKEAIESIVNVINQLEKEKGYVTCRNEVVSAVKRVLKMMLDSSDIDKLTAWEHHRLVILELCNAPLVCTEIVNYLISELEKLISVAIQTTEENMRESTVVMDKSYILFHSLKIVLKKYRSFTLTRVTTGEGNASQKIPEVTDLWKKYWRVNDKEPDIFVTSFAKLEILEDSKQVWIRVLEELVVVSTTVWPLVKILAWQCLTMLKSVVSSAARDG